MAVSKVRLYRATPTTLASMCTDADDQLFAKVTLTLNIFYTICYLLYANNITLSVNDLTTTACQNAFQPSWTKTS